VSFVTIFFFFKAQKTLLLKSCRLRRLMWRNLLFPWNYNLVLSFPRESKITVSYSHSVISLLYS